MGTVEEVDAFLRKLNTAILKQTVRDLASKDIDISVDSKKFILSKEFDSLCKSLDLDTKKTTESLQALSAYPIVSRKFLAEEITKIINNPNSR
jgi:predicted phosphohydrolase|tara:strand:+ start:119 stop:397 length:279 start_codon:yes stop_codon:yes gene_type:complete